MSLPNIPASVKRRYESPLREAQARETRRAILCVAATLFAERGYVATSFDAIADVAGVGRATVFAHFPTKAALLKTAYDITLVGDDEPIPFPDRPRSREVRAERDARRFLAGYAEIVAEVLGRVAPIYEAIRGAASADAEAAAVWKEIGQERRRGAGNVVRETASRTPLRAGLDPEHAADVVWALNDAGLYHLLVIQREWTHESFVAWLAEALIRELLPIG